MRRAILALSLAVLPFPTGGTGGFIDVRPTDNDAAAISYVQQEGIMTGNYGRFDPDRPVTRAELAKIAAQANDIEILDIDTAPFPDVPTSHSLAREVAAIKRLNQHYTDTGYGNRSVLTGYPDGTFRPQDTATYAETAKVLLGAARFEPGEGRAFFVQKDFPGYQATSLSDFYNHAAQRDLYGAPIDWYQENANRPTLRRDVARFLKKIHRWYELSPQTPDLFVCRPGSSWNVRIRDNALWSRQAEESAAFSDLCVSEQLGVGFNLYTAGRFDGNGSYLQVYSFRTDDRTDRAAFDGWGAIGGVHMATNGLSLYGCIPTETGRMYAVFECAEQGGRIVELWYNALTGDVSTQLPQ